MSNRPYRQATARTVFLRVPIAEWPKVRAGVKREFRASGGHQTQVWNLATPCAVVAYAVRHTGSHEARLMVLERTWREKLGAISPESLAAEGCRTLAEFKRAWAKREKRRFPPLREVQVYRVRPINLDDDVPELGAALFKRLYGDFM